MRLSKLIIFMGSKEKFKPNIKMLEFIRLFRSCFVICH